MGRTRILRCALLLSSAVVAVQSAQAQDSQTPQNRVTGGIEDIVVTARRTEENLQTTPVAVTALGAEAIKNAQITDAAALQKTAPGLSISTGSAGGSGFANISIRGSATLNPGTANDPAVATYLDGVYIARPSQGLTDLIDMQRIEVLRGPQGTLFGRNTTGGALNIITRDPTGDFEGEVRGRIGNYGLRNAGATLNVPIMGEELAMRVVYEFTDRNGYARNSFTGQDVNDRNSQYVRGKIKWAPADSDWSVTLAGDYNKIKDHGQFVGLKDFLPTANPAIGAINALFPLSAYLHTKDSWYTTANQQFINNYTTEGKYSGRNNGYDRLTASGGSLTVEGRLGDINVKSITAYRYSFSIGLGELDGTPIQILAAESYYGSKQWSQELQFSGDLTDRLSYIFGGYYSNEKGSEASLSQTFGVLQPPTSTNKGYAENRSAVRNKSTGVFGQLYYDITDRLSFTGGLRWTWDTRGTTSFNRTSINPSVCAAELVSQPDFQPPCSLGRVAKFNYPAWTAGLDFKANDNVFAYIKTSGAAKAGGWNLRNGSVNTPAFDPEKVKDIELGLKLESDDRRARANIAIFYSWQTGVQRNAGAVVNGLTTQYLLNAGDQDVYGAEFELTVIPWEGMTLAGNASLQAGNYRRGSFTETRAIAGGTGADCVPNPANPAAPLCIVDRSGENVPQLPQTQVNISANQVFPLGFGELALHANYSYVSSQWFDTTTADPRESAATIAALTRQNQLGRIDGYGLLDGRVSVTLNEPDLEVYAFAKNITGKKYTTRSFSNLYSSLGVAFEWIGQPFTWGVGTTFRF